MARGELLRNLLLSQTRGDADRFRTVALKIIEEEQRKNNHQLAKDLLRILENGAIQYRLPNRDDELKSLPRDRERQALLIEIRHPDRTFADIILRESEQTAVQRVIEEFRSAELLRVHGLKPKTKLLFCGPPGCGKTLCAEILACELGLPLLYARFDAIVSSYLGETAANLRKVFDHASTGRWVVLFDEFDAIGKERDDPAEHGELKRVVNSFLQLLDSFSARSIIIAATNHEQLLDPALWRRFDEIVSFPRPSQSEIEALIEMKLKNFPRKGVKPSVVARQLSGFSHADVERTCIDAIKTSILGAKDFVDTSIFSAAIRREKARLNISRRANKKRK